MAAYELQGRDTEMRAWEGVSWKRLWCFPGFLATSWKELGDEDEDEEGRERGPKGNRGGAEEAGYGVGVGGPTRKDCCKGTDEAGDILKTMLLRSR
ncbi:hypothetical protein CFAM422_006713 [Trichoderma lentiforme]|uniref:Uncharacterized protein n=1 Tax=Trichoderma lentiforme TaxID=1567552 RepID=A0A9P5CBA9_9HYPO|nr:hypothetical protein CFAM422_006713 [Trichoderma lentiforme]